MNASLFLKLQQSRALSASPFQLWFTVLEFLVLVSGESRSYTATTLSPSVHWSNDRAVTKMQRLYLWGESNKPLSPRRHSPPVPVSLLACLPAYHSTSITYISIHRVVCLRLRLSHLLACSPVFPSLCLSSRLTESAHLPLSPRLSFCNLTWRLSLVFFRAWLVGWPTFGLIRVTYRSEARTYKYAHTHARTHAHKQECTGSSFNLTLALSPGLTHKPSTHQHHSMWVSETHKLIWTTTYVQRHPTLHARLEFFPYF